jgi:hypothetical protein
LYPPIKLTLFSVQFENVFIVCKIFLPGPRIALADGVPSVPLGLIRFETQSFTLAIEPGARVTCSTTADSGDADLFIRFGAEPDLVEGRYICSGITDLSIETCIARDPGVNFVLWALVEAFTSIENLEITCSATLPPPPTLLTDGVASDPFSLSSSQTQTFTLAVASGETVMCETAADNGDAFLLVRWDVEPSTELVSADCISASENSTASCNVVDPGNASVLWVLVYAAFSDVSRLAISVASLSHLSKNVSPLWSSPIYSLPQPRSHAHASNQRPLDRSSLYRKT